MTSGRVRQAGKGGASRILRWIPLLLAVLLLLAGYAAGLHRYLSLEALRQYQDILAEFVSARPLAAALLYVSAYCAAVALSFPGASILTVTGGFMFGWALGTLLSVLAATTGATLIFVMARTSLGCLLAERAGPRMVRLRCGFREEGFSYLLFLRLVPLFPFWLVNLAAGLFGMRLLPYVAATAIGIVPGTFVLSYFGGGLGTALEREGVPFSPQLLVAFALLGILALVPPLLRRRRAACPPARGCPRDE